MDACLFAQRLHEVEEIKTTVDRAVALLWLAGQEDPTTGMSGKDVARVLEIAGFPSQNASRLQTQMEGDSRTAKATAGGLRLRPASRRMLDPLLSKIVGPRPIARSDSIIPMEILERTRRDYLRRVGHQINASYDARIYDCCAVMLRRLIETLVIEVFENASMLDAIQSASGSLCMLNELLATLHKNNTRFHVGRNSHRGLSELKDLGDKSAHNRRFNATQSDIDRLRADIRTAVDELVHLAALAA